MKNFLCLLIVLFACVAPSFAQHGAPNTVQNSGLPPVAQPFGLPINNTEIAPHFAAFIVAPPLS